MGSAPSSIEGALLPNRDLASLNPSFSAPEGLFKAPEDRSKDRDIAPQSLWDPNPPPGYKKSLLHIVTHECVEGDAVRCVIRAVPEGSKLEPDDYVRVGDIAKALGVDLEMPEWDAGNWPPQGGELPGGGVQHWSSDSGNTAITASSTSSSSSPATTTSNSTTTSAPSTSISSSMPSSSRSSTSSSSSFSRSMSSSTSSHSSTTSLSTLSTSTATLTASPSSQSSTLSSFQTFIWPPPSSSSSKSTSTPPTTTSSCTGQFTMKSSPSSTPSSAWWMHGQNQPWPTPQSSSTPMPSSSSTSMAQGGPPSGPMRPVNMPAPNSFTWHRNPAATGAASSSKPVYVWRGSDGKMHNKFFTDKKQRPTPAPSTTLMAEKREISKVAEGSWKLAYPDPATAISVSEVLELTRYTPDPMPYFPHTTTPFHRPYPETVTLKGRQEAELATATGEEVAATEAPVAEPAVPRGRVGKKVLDTEYEQHDVEFMLNPNSSYVKAVQEEKAKEDAVPNKQLIPAATLSTSTLASNSFKPAQSAYNPLLYPSPKPKQQYGSPWQHGHPEPHDWSKAIMILVLGFGAVVLAIAIGVYFIRVGGPRRSKDRRAQTMLDRGNI